MKSPKCEVVKFYAPDGYMYTGLLYKPVLMSYKTIIHVHGMCGNMLSFSPLVDLADAYVENGYNFLTFNLKAHDCIAEGVWANDSHKDDLFYYVGGSLEVFERCVVDIESAIEFVSQFSKVIFLQGHSMGCERIITYQILSKKNYHTILLSPCDAYQLQQDYIYPKTIEEQRVELEQYDENVLLPPDFFGINSSKGEKYTIPIYKMALDSILTGYALKIFRQDKDYKFYLPIHCLCLIGENDPLQTYMPQKAFSLLKNKFQCFEGHALQGDHEMIPAISEMVSKVLDWLSVLDSVGY